MTNDDINSSTRHVFDALRCVASVDGAIGGSEVARRIGVPISTAHRALVTLEVHDFVSRAETDSRFQLGTRALELVAGLTSRYRIGDYAGPLLRSLARDTGETASLDVRLGWYGVCVDGYEGWQPIHSPLAIGRAYLLHEFVPGRVLLSGEPEDVIRRYVRSRQSGELKPATARQLSDDLEAIALKGYCAAREDFASDADAVAAMAMPVRAEDGRILAAVSLIGPAAQFDPEGSVPHYSALSRVVVQLQEAVAAATRSEEASFDDPFGHVEPDEISLALG